MLYKRVVENFKKFYMIPENEDIHKFIGTRTNRAWYVSTHLYTEEQKKIFDETGSVAGITDLIGKTLIWDFDNENDVNIARLSAIQLIDRLKASGIQDDCIKTQYSGKKGIHVIVEIDKELTPRESEAICTSYAHDLVGFDTTLYDANQVYRIPLTLHKSGRYCLPLSLDDLMDMSIEEIVESSKNVDEFSIKDYNEYYRTMFWTLPIPSVKDIKVLSKTFLDDVVYNIEDIDFNALDKSLSIEKAFLELGYFEEGERNHALMILCATYRSIGYPKLKAYKSLKAAAEMQMLRCGGEKFPKGEIWDTIIKPCYSKSWRGGVYSVETDPILQRIHKLLPEHMRHKERKDIVDVKGGLFAFHKYAEEIDKNSISFGLPEIDEKLRAQTGQFIGLLASPGIGKTSWLLTVATNMSKQNIPCLIFQFDMAPPIFFQKLIQRETGLSAKRIYEIYKNKDREAIKKIEEEVDFSFGNVDFVFNPGLNIEDIAKTIEEREKKTGRCYKFIGIDYLELVLSKFSDPVQATAETSQGLRYIANTMNKCVMVLLQPNKANTKMDEPITNFTSAKGSGSIGQSCTAMLTACRPGYDPLHPEHDKYFTITCVKNRMGAMFSYDYSWCGAQGIIRQLTEEEREDLNQLRERKAAAKDAEKEGGW